VRTEVAGRRARRERSPETALEAPHLSAEGVSRYLAQHGLAPAKRRSQNHLVDAAVLADVVALAAVTPGRQLLEIGPGLGILTGALLEAGAHVSAVELDRRLADDLRRRFGRQIEAGALRLTEADALDVPVADLVEPPYDLVANLPYHITSPVLHHVLGHEPRPRRFVLMLQREVADRIAAAPGAMSYLSVFVQYHAAVRVARIVARTAFEPAPAVESAVLVGETRPRVLSTDEEDGLWRLVQAGFRERRKMLHNVLPRQLSHIPRAHFDAALAQLGIAPDRRPQTLSVAEWLALWRALGAAV
jgi:16S rRNA (adenine1518-N6/adenine1519-N6)-dimethyltransferase